MNPFTREGDAATPAVGAVSVAAKYTTRGNTNNGANNQQQQQVARALYHGTSFTGNLPAPTGGEVAHYTNRSASTVELRAQAEVCFAFLNDPISDLRDLNRGMMLFTALIDKSTN